MDKMGKIDKRKITTRMVIIEIIEKKTETTRQNEIEIRSDRE
jgi:hypothetical protein